MTVAFSGVHDRRSIHHDNIKPLTQITRKGQARLWAKRRKLRGQQLMRIQRGDAPNDLWYVIDDGRGPEVLRCNAVVEGPTFSADGECVRVEDGGEEVSRCE